MQGAGCSVKGVGCRVQGGSGGELRGRCQRRHEQGYLAEKKKHPPQDPTLGPCLGLYGGPGGGGLFLRSEVPLYRIKHVVTNTYLIANERCLAV